MNSTARDDSQRIDDDEDDGIPDYVLDRLARAAKEKANKPKFPEIPPVQAQNIPELLKGVSQWIVWRAGPIKPNGKFDKFPTHPRTGRNINHLDEKNWLSFKAAMTAYQGGIGHGIGFVLSDDHKVTVAGVDNYIVAVDLDGMLKDRGASAKEVWLKLGQPYLEHSPSRKGLRMFALSTEPIRGGNAGEGRELYSNKRFVTVTGWGSKGTMKDATTGVVALDKEWFPEKTASTKPVLDYDWATASRNPPPPEIEQEIARVKDALSCVSPDVPYEMWRNIVWAILSTGWTCAKQLARDWSMSVINIKGAKHTYEEEAFDALVRDFDPTRRISLGTLFHHAKEAGWRDTRWRDRTIHVQDPAPHHCFTLLTAEEVKAQPIAPYRIKGLLPAQGVAAIYGQSGSGKSFLGMDMCFAIAAGCENWFGMKVKQAPVVWAALEGRGGISKRIKAWEEQYQEKAPDGIRFLLGDFVLSEPENIIGLASAIGEEGKGGIVVIDTLNQSAPGIDENSSADMGNVLANAKKLADLIDGLVLLIHHAGKDQSRGMRGHSSLKAAMDATIEVVRDASGVRSLRIEKAKDDEDGGVLRFELVAHVVGQDEDGFDITSCAVRQTIHVSAAAAIEKPPRGKNQIAAFAKVRELLASAPDGMSFGEAAEAVSTVLECESRRRNTVAKDTIKSLIASGHIELNEGAITLP